MIKLKATCGTEFIIDKEFVDMVAPYAWMIHKARTNKYVYSFDKNNNNKIFRLHRMLMFARDGEIIDHINHNGLDNRLENLRFVNSSQNSVNRGIKPRSNSGYYGVSWEKRKKRYGAYFCHNYKHIWVGRFKSAKAAAIARDKMIIEYHGDYATLNFPELRTHQKEQGE